MKIFIQIFILCGKNKLHKILSRIIKNFGTLKKFRKRRSSRYLPSYPIQDLGTWQYHDEALWRRRSKASTVLSASAIDVLQRFLRQLIPWSSICPLPCPRFYFEWEASKASLFREIIRVFISLAATASGLNRTSTAFRLMHFFLFIFVIANVSKDLIISSLLFYKIFQASKISRYR